MRKTSLWVVLTLVFGMTVGCASTSHQGQQQAAGPQQGSPQQDVKRDTISYGMVTSKVEKGKTTQIEIIELFGSPNITSINAEGEEVWVYDKISSQTSGSGSSEADRFNAFFSLGVLGGGGSSAGTQYNNSRSSTTRTLTVIITFDQDKKVREYSARSTQF